MTKDHSPSDGRPTNLIKSRRTIRQNNIKVNIQERVRNYVDCFLVVQNEYQQRAVLIVAANFIYKSLGHYWLIRC